MAMQSESGGLTYDQMMTEATDLIHREKYVKAISLLNEASTLEVFGSQEASAFQLKAIAWRLSGNYTEANLWFNEALSSASEDKPLAARIKRDLAMNDMDRARSTSNLHEKLRLLKKSEGLLKESYQELLTLNFQLEAAVSYGFMGRSMYLQGHESQALTILNDVDKKLQQGPNRNYELDNLMWLLLVAKNSDRPGLVKRALKLIAETGQYRRYKQLPVAALRGDKLAGFVQQLFGK